MQIKFCGITRSCDIQIASRLGVDALGLVFYPPSSRYVTPATAARLARLTPPFVSLVGLFVNVDAVSLTRICQSVPLDVLQFHGDESADECQALAAAVGKRWYKALRVGEGMNIKRQIDVYYKTGASAVLLDACVAGAYGGTGRSFDWQLVPDTPCPIILAGGLTAENVHLTRDLPIDALDVSGGIESIAGIKDAKKMQDFVRIVREF